MDAKASLVSSFWMEQGTTRHIGGGKCSHWDQGVDVPDAEYEQCETQVWCGHGREVCSIGEGYTVCEVYTCVRNTRNRRGTDHMMWNVCEAEMV